MCGGGPRGLSSEEIAAQTRANKELAEAETAKINAERQAEKEKEAQKAMADNKAMADADQKRKHRQHTNLGGILDDEDDDTLLAGTAAPSVAKSKTESKTICSRLGSTPQCQLLTHSPRRRVRQSLFSSRSRPLPGLQWQQHLQPVQGAVGKVSNRAKLAASTLNGSRQQAAVLRLPSDPSWIRSAPQRRENHEVQTASEFV